jgi:hypothetical protein
MSDRHSVKATSICLFTSLLAIVSCNKSDDAIEIAGQTLPETADLTHLPFGGTSPTNILIRNQGDSQPDFLSLWLCGLPSNGAGNSDASDWTNTDG